MVEKRDLKRRYRQTEELNRTSLHALDLLGFSHIPVWISEFFEIIE